MIAAWACLCPGCNERGQTNGTESSADAKHVKATGHATVTSTRAELLDRIAGRAS